MAKEIKVKFTQFAIVDCVEYSDGDEASVHYRIAEELIRNGRAEKVSKKTKTKGSKSGKTNNEDKESIGRNTAD